MKIAVIGTGGVGGYFGGQLARTGNDVTFIARGEHLRAIQENGLKVKSIKGDFTIRQAKASGSFAPVAEAQLVIIAVKAWQISEIGKELSGMVGKETMVMPLQNGISAANELQGMLGPKNIIGGLCRIISKIESPGVINHFGIEPTVVFGELDNAKSERIRRLKALFDHAGIKANISNDIIADLWKKFIPICVSGLLAVTGTTYGELREHWEKRKLMVELLNEIFRLSQKIGINIESDFVEKSVSFIDSYPYDSTSSLTRDIWEGKPSELEYQNGTVVKLAQKYGVATPVNMFVYNSLLPMEIKARKK